jgi:hypothetical protein
VFEVTFENGKKVLNVGEVNYSYGALHDIFRIALNKANISTRFSMKFKSIFDIS